MLENRYFLLSNKRYSHYYLPFLIYACLGICYATCTTAVCNVYSLYLHGSVFQYKLFYCLLANQGETSDIKNPPFKV